MSFVLALLLLIGAVMAGIWAVWTVAYRLGVRDGRERERDDRWDRENGVATDDDYGHVCRRRDVAG